jgi:hypothetical protein
MKKFFKSLLVVILLGGAVAGGGYYYLNYFKKPDYQEIFNAVPDNAIFVIETSNAPKAWDEFTQSDIWKHLSLNPNLAEIDSYMTYFEEILAYPGVNALFHGGLADRNILLSAHLVGGNDYDFIYIVDMKKAPNVLAFSKALTLAGYDIQERKYKGETIIELHDNTSTDVIYMTLYDNLLLVSYVGSLIEDALLHRLEDKWTSKESFIKVAGSIRNTQLANFYFNFKQLPGFVNVFAGQEIAGLDNVAQQLAFSAFGFFVDNTFLRLNGFTSVDSMPSYFKALSNVNPGKSRVHEILSDQTALYFSLGFESFNSFYAALTSQYSASSPDDFEDIQGNVQKLEKLLKINLQENVFNWIGQEIVFAKMRPQANERAEDVLVAIHAHDIQFAKDGFAHIIKQVERRSPAKFSETEYKNFTIAYLDVKGFFRVFLGKLFDKLEKPYITYIEDYVLMSNSLETLKKAIDDYALGQTLHHNEKFVAFRENFAIKSNISIYIQMPKLYESLISFADADDKKAIEENKELILSFARIGFELNAENGVFSNLFLAEHDTSALDEDKMDLIEQNTMDSSSVVSILEIDLLNQISDSSVFANGPVKIYFDSTQNNVFMEAMAVSGKLNGMAKIYHPNGKMNANLNYKNNVLHGECIFYYDDQNFTKKIMAAFKDGKLDGELREFYQTGAQKSILLYQNNLLDGEAKYFYPSGSIKMEGEYADSLKTGKWKFYDEKGLIISKKRYKKGV